MKTFFKQLCFLGGGLRLRCRMQVGCKATGCKATGCKAPGLLVAGCFIRAGPGISGGSGYIRRVRSGYTALVAVSSAARAFGH